MKNLKSFVKSLLPFLQSVFKKYKKIKSISLFLGMRLKIFQSEAENDQGGVSESERSGVGRNCKGNNMILECHNSKVFTIYVYICIYLSI